MEEIFFVKNDFYRFSYRNTRRLANLPVHICVEIFHTPDSLILLNLKLLFLITNISVQSMLHVYNKGDRFSSYRLCWFRSVWKTMFYCFVAFEKNNKYTPKINLMAASLYAKNTKGTFEKIYPIIILIVHIIPNKIIDFPCTK